MAVQIILNGEQHEFDDDSTSLLDALRGVGCHSVKDGCSPQGQCGCCTVLVDGKPRVSCVTALRRVEGRSITTLEGLSSETATAWGEAFCDTGGSQCGFCTPGIIMRLEPLREDDRLDPVAVRKALGAHLCRCTGWQPIVEAAVQIGTGANAASTRDLDLAEQRALLEGGTRQSVSPAVALGRGGFADDEAPSGALVAMANSDGEWVLGETVSQARGLSGRIQGRATTLAPTQPLDVPSGEWDLTLQTSWVDPAYLETDATWCEPGGEPASMVANGGAFGAKLTGELGAVARRLADESGRPVRVLLSREETARLGPKRPPLAIGINRDGSGAVNAVRTEGLAALVSDHFPTLTLTEFDVAGPPTSLSIRAAGWAELAACQAVAAASISNSAPAISATHDLALSVTQPSGGSATATIGADGSISISVDAGSPLDEVVLRSYCIGAAHMATSWVRSEGLAVSEAGEVQDLTIRSFGVLKATDMPHTQVEVASSDGPPVAVTDAVFAAVAAATWIHVGTPTVWPAVGR